VRIEGGAHPDGCVEIVGIGSAILNHLTDNRD
jgi:hypothetical protein